MKEKLKLITDKLDWRNINHEKRRIYVFPAGNIVILVSPVYLNVSKSGGHRILTSDNVAHYIPSGWIHLYWETYDNVAFRF